MELIIRDARIPVEKDTPDEYVKAASLKLGISEKDIAFVKLLNKALDLKNNEQFYYEVSFVVRTPDSVPVTENLTVYTERIPEIKKLLHGEERPIVIGFGPAGMFAALELVERGMLPLVFERGKNIEDRSLDVHRFITERALDPESNIQFGEGGAGSFSDGKLFAKKNNSIQAAKVLETFIKFGAPEEIRYLGKPHVGTDVLCRIVRAIREYLLERGADIQYSSKMTRLIIEDGMARGVVINGEKEYRSSRIYLAVGHSARDTFAHLHEQGIALEQRAIFIGVRVEHPVGIIDQIRYGDKYKGFPGLGAATYSFHYTDRNIKRGVYTFCMCPGGEVVNASSEDGMLAVNGMSYAARSSAFSNAALVVNCHTSDYGSDHPLAGIEFQKNIERKAFQAGGGRWKAPAQNVPDFLHGRASESLNENSFKMGVTPADMNTVFPEFITGTLTAAFNSWKGEYPLFVSGHAILIGAETRTSCPVRVTRNEAYESVNMKNLYPIGEGAGYAGGITSSAADAIKAVDCSLSASESGR